LLLKAKRDYWRRGGDAAVLRGEFIALLDERAR